ncbi:SDR family NAD(P)-dependent oxidoreductase [Sphingomonas tabacisoli]|uniref:SDR family NAD(P)-dependent oxidoreductase n=1 Tax=Sphingomonas tabacisoli TaxID=2249466 RepID=A0ABW4HZH7_9SPHN
MAGKLAMVTGASSGIGLELARLAAADGYDLILAADTPFVEAGPQLRRYDVQIDEIECDLSTFDGVDRLLDACRGRKVDLLFANAGHGLGHGFLDQSPAEWRHVIDTNITGTLYLLQKVLREMVARNEGRVLITGSIAGHMAGSFQAVYNGTKAFIDSFADAIHNELKDTDVVITCLKPGATETEFFHRAEMDDTKVGQAEKDDPVDVAKTGYDALMKGDRSVISGFKNKLQVAAASVLGGGCSAEAHRKQAEPGSGD